MECLGCHRDVKSVGNRLPGVDWPVCGRCSYRWKIANQHGFAEAESERNKRRRKEQPERHRKADRKWAQNHPDKVRDRHLRLEFGITLQQYQEILKAQGGGCAICGTKDPGEGRKNFCVDHSHVTGEVRGLLCAAHNKMLGFAQDDIRVLCAGVAYLGGDRPWHS